MRKCLILLLALALLCPVSASAVEGPKFVALTFEGLPAGAEGQALLDGLSARDTRATFFLWAGPWEQGQQVLDGGHEIGLLAPDSLNRLSRRQVAAQFRSIRALMPPCRVRYLMVQGRCSDGVRQVAGVQGLSFMADTLDPWEDVPMGDSLLARVKNGDTLYLRAATRGDVVLALNLIDLLQSRGFRLVTASELARLLPAE